VPDNFLLQVFHNEVKKALINQTKAEAKVYGQIYAQALSKASPDLQEVCLSTYLFLTNFTMVEFY